MTVHKFERPAQHDAFAGATFCEQDGRENCEGHGDPVEAPPQGFADDELEDGADVALEGLDIEARGVPYVLDGIVPAYGMLGFLVAYAKVGKTTFGQALAAHIAVGRPFLDRTTTAARVLVIAAEDPPEYTAWLARHMSPERGRLLFRRKPIILNEAELSQICATVKRRQIGLVLIASWQAVIRGLIKDENDNAGAVAVVEAVKIAARASAVPWLIDAHSGKGEDQGDEADPSRAMRGASAAAGAADYTLSLRYENGAFGTRRRFSGKGRFVTFEPLTLEFDAATSVYSVTAGGGKSVSTEADWRLIQESGAISADPRSVAEIGRLSGIIMAGKSPNGGQRNRIHNALRRPDVLRSEAPGRGGKTTSYRLVDAA